MKNLDKLVGYLATAAVVIAVAYFTKDGFYAFLTAVVGFYFVSAAD